MALHDAPQPNSRREPAPDDAGEHRDDGGFLYVRAPYREQWSGRFAPGAAPLSARARLQTTTQAESGS